MSNSLKCGNCGKEMTAIHDPFRPVEYVCEECRDIPGYRCDICGYIHDDKSVVLSHVLKAHRDTFTEDLYDVLADNLPDIQDEVLEALATVLAPGTNPRKFVVEKHVEYYGPREEAKASPWEPWCYVPGKMRADKCRGCPCLVQDVDYGAEVRYCRACPEHQQLIAL